jgi:hypothetical protein
MAAARSFGAAMRLTHGLRVADAIGILETVRVVRPMVSLMLRHNAMLVARYDIRLLEGSARVRAWIEIGFAAPRISFVERVKLGRNYDHVGASGQSA